MPVSADTVVLNEKAYVSCDRIYLRDIGVVQGPNKQELSSLCLLRSTSIAEGINLSSDYVEKKIRESHPEMQVTMKGSPNVYVCQKLVKISAEELETIYRNAVMRSSQWKDKGKIIIEDVKIPANVSIPEGAKDLIQAKFSPQEDFLGLTTAAIILGSDALTPVCRISAKIKVIAEVPVPKAKIPRRAIISDASLVMRATDISAYPNALVDKKECLGMRAKTVLQEGKPILKSNVEQPPLVNRGDFVFIEARSDVLMIQDRGIALKDGYIHERIPVRNVTSGRQIYGTVIAPLQVEVTF
jgi:flagella basal body P-ring formation protein FlgA